MRVNAPIKLPDQTKAEDSIGNQRVSTPIKLPAQTKV
jgi:hypothetical protein